MLSPAVWSILLILASPVIVLGNVLILSAWIRFKRLRTPSNALIVSLAIADLGFGLFLPVAVAVDLAVPVDENHPCNMSMCIGPFAMLLVFCAASLLSTTAIALDRFTSVAQPLRYNHFVTMSYVQRFVAANWVYAGIIGIVPIVFVKEAGAEVVIAWLTIFLYAPCVTSTVLSYGYIYVVARSHARAIYSVEVSLNNGSTCEVVDTSSMHHHRYGLTLALILGSILLCWLPIQVSAIVDLAAGTGILLDHQTRMLVATPVVLSSVINPWLYGYRSSEIRWAVIRLLDCIVTRVTGRPPTMNLFYQQHKGDMTSCASNVRLLTISPTQTTVQCCSNGCNGETKKYQPYLMICDQVSTL